MTTLQFLLASLIWGASFLLIELALEGFRPLVLVSLRLSFGLAFLVAYARFRRLPFDGGALLWLGGGGIGLLTLAFPFFAISWGQQHIDSGLTAVLNSSVPLFTLLLTPFVNREARLPARQTRGVLIGFGGVLVLATSAGMSGAIAGVLAVLSGSASYALSALLMTRFLHGQHFVSVITIGMGTSLVLLWPMAIFSGAGELATATSTAWISIAALGVLGTGCAHVLFMAVLRAWGPARSSTITYMIPPIGVALGVLVLDERLTWHLLAGGALIAAGVVIANRR